jgi:hypothetical protein
MVEQFKPEEKAEIIIWDWLKTKSNSVVEIYFNRENKIGWGNFIVKGNQRKPDFIVKTDNGYGIEYIAIEIKSADKSKDVLDAHKILDYWNNYIKGETKYYIDNQEIKIKHFLIATDSSPKGYLFEKEDIKDNFADTESKSKHYAASIGIIPRYEGQRTFEIIRLIWNLYSKIRQQHEEKCGIGILIADLNDNLIPKMMISYYNKDKKRWGQRFWKI